MEILQSGIHAHNIQGDPTKSHKVFELRPALGPVLFFHMCFRLRILRPFHLDTLMIAIQNLGGHKTLKTMPGSFCINEYLITAVS